MHCTDFQVWPCGACGPRRRDWRGLDLPGCFHGSTSLLLPLSQWFQRWPVFFLSQRTDAQNLERDRRGFIPASLRWRLFYKDSIFSLCVCDLFFLDCSVSIREGGGDAHQ
jgi:hypothetical protein